MDAIKFQERIDFMAKYKDDHNVIIFDNTTASETEELARAFGEHTTRRIITATYSHVADVISETRARLGEVAPFELFLKTFNEAFVIFITEFDEFKEVSEGDWEFFQTLLRFNLDSLIIITGRDIREIGKELLKKI